MVARGSPAPVKKNGMNGTTTSQEVGSPTTPASISSVEDNAGRTNSKSFEQEDGKHV